MHVLPTAVFTWDAVGFIFEIVLFHTEKAL